MRKVIPIIVVVLLSSFIYIFIRHTKNRRYVDTLESARTSKDIWLHNDLNSPFVIYHVAFDKIDYYPVDPKWAINADFIQNTENDSLLLITSTGEKRNDLIFGTVTFTYNNTLCSLLILLESNGGKTTLFIPFMDKTSGHTTYGGGRYLEADFPVGDHILLDFNKAYNPYCAYSEGYSCPLPPKANVLKIPIEAGEKSFAFRGEQQH